MLRALTGLNRKAFDALLSNFEQAYLVLPERKLRSIDAFMEMFPDVERVMIDGTERLIQRPQDAEQQTQNYSGKKRRHTRKHLAAVDQTKRVLV